MAGTGAWDGGKSRAKKQVGRGAPWLSQDGISLLRMSLDLTAGLPSSAEEQGPR